MEPDGWIYKKWESKVGEHKALFLETLLVKLEGEIYHGLEFNSQGVWWFDDFVILYSFCDRRDSSSITYLQQRFRRKEVGVIERESW